MRETSLETSIEHREMTVIDYLLERLHRMGITSIFAVPGAHIDMLLNAVVQDKRFKLIIASHEEGAGFMADGFARITEGPSVVMTINGPGISNLVPALIMARTERIPILAITGDATTIVKDRGGFQSSDPSISNSRAVVQAAIGNSYIIDFPEDLSSVLDKYEEQINGNIGIPYHINIPFDVQKQIFDYRFRPSKAVVSHSFDSMIIPDVGEKIVVLVGEEVRTTADRKLVADFCEKYGIPAASTLNAKQFQSFLPEHLQLGIYGYAGGPRANETVLRSDIDTLIVIGAILNERNTLVWDDKFFGNRNVFHLTFEPEVLAEQFGIIDIQVDSVKNAISIIENANTDNGDKISELLIMKKEFRERWSSEFLDLPIYPEKYSVSDNELSSSGSPCLYISEVLDTMNKAMPHDIRLFLDSGDHRIMAGYYWKTRTGGDFYTAGITAPMGWAIGAGIGAGIGASVEKMDETICVLCGDGCMMMHGMELAVAARYNVKVIIFVSNNSSFGRIASRLKDKDPIYCQSISDLPKMDWVKFADSMNVKGMKVDNTDMLEEAIHKGLSVDGPFLIELITVPGEPLAYKKGVFSSFNFKLSEEVNNE